MGDMIKAKITLVTLFYLFFGFLPAARAGSAQLTFEQFYQKVLIAYPKLKAAHQDVEIALAQQMQSNAGFWPSLNLYAGYHISEDPVDVFGTLLREERFTSADFDLKRLNSPSRQQNFSTGLHAELPLFDSLQTIFRARSARDMVKVVETEEVFVRMEALLMAQDAYLNALTLKNLSLILDEVQSLSEQDLSEASSLKDKGRILGADYFLARVMSADFLRAKNEVIRQKRGMMVLLNILMGEPLEKTWSLTTSQLQGQEASVDFQELLSAAYLKRPDLVALEYRLKVLDSEISREKATVLPNVKAFGEVTNDRETLNASGGNNYSVGVKAQMPLFDPSREGRIKEAKAKRERLKQDIQSLKDAISRDLIQEISRRDSLMDNMNIMKGMTEDAQQSVQRMLPLYQEGRKSIADLLQARRLYLQVNQDYTKALMALSVSQARLFFLSGQLDEDNINKIAQGAGL